MNLKIFGLGIGMIIAGTVGSLMFNPDFFFEGSVFHQSFTITNGIATWTFFIGLAVAVIGALEK